jgi:DNA-binding CsgD family transcriptional regulator
VTVRRIGKLPWVHPPDPKTALLSRAFFASAGVTLAAVALLALTPLTVSWPLKEEEGVELATGVLVILLVNYAVMRAVFARRGPFHSRPRTGHGELTVREIEIVRLIAHGYTAKEIAEILFISPKTVDAHRGHILSKLELRDRVELTRYAIRHRLVDP